MKFLTQKGNMSKFKNGDKVEFEYEGKTHKGVVESDYPHSSSVRLYSDVKRLHNGDEGNYGYESYWNTEDYYYDMRLDGTPYVKKVGTMNRYNIGSDPEFFYMKDGKVLSSELVLPKDGLQSAGGKITIDGVQAEINPTTESCRELHANQIARCLHRVKQELPKGVTVSFDPLVPIELPVLSKLSEKAQHFGCTPSYNVYDNDNKMSISDSSKYPFRPAGGHIHLGGSNNSDYKKLYSDLKTLIPMLDIIVGNTCVLIDRHEGNKERRRCYGRAGEFRTPKHGVEYRTLSNFWLKSYPLMSFVFALGRMAMDIIHFSTKENNFVKEIMDAVDIKDIRKAINNNDFDLALKNFSKIKPILEKRMNTEHPLNSDNMKEFLYFVGKVNTKGLDYWFNADPLKYWYDVVENGSRGDGWERFLVNKVRKEIQSKKSVAGKIIKKLGL